MRNPAAKNCRSGEAGEKAAAQISSAVSPTRSSGTSSPSSRPGTAPARRPSPAGGGPSGASRLSTYRWTASLARTASASSSPPRSSPNTPAPAGVLLRDRFAKIDGWLRSRALTGLWEIEFSYYAENPQLPHPIPPSALRFAPTLCKAKFACCDFPSVMVPELNFPYLKKLSLHTISEDALHSLLSGCSVLENLLLEYIVGIGRLCISSQTLKSIGFNAGWKSSVAIRIQELEMIALKLTTSMRTVKVLALDSLGPNLNAVVDFLKCFPCVEKLYVTCTLQKTMKNALTYNSLDPIECLEVHLKKMVMSNYHGMKPDVDFAKFFVLNAKVPEEMDFGAMCFCNEKWMANQRRRLQVNNKASQGARFAFGYSHGMAFNGFSKPDPFEWMNHEDFL
nr:unnamed protein product [Digitaria exilis]